MQTSVCDIVEIISENPGNTCENTGKGKIWEARVLLFVQSNWLKEKTNVKLKSYLKLIHSNGK